MKNKINNQTNLNAAYAHSLPMSLMCAWNVKLLSFAKIAISSGKRKKTEKIIVHFVTQKTQNLSQWWDLLLAWETQLLSLVKRMIALNSCRKWLFLIISSILVNAWKNNMIALWIVVYNWILNKIQKLIISIAKIVYMIAIIVPLNQF